MTISQHEIAPGSIELVGGTCVLDPPLPNHVSTIAAGGGSAEGYTISRGNAAVKRVFGRRGAPQWILEQDTLFRELVRHRLDEQRASDEARAALGFGAREAATATAALAASAAARTPRAGTAAVGIPYRSSASPSNSLSA